MNRSLLTLSIVLASLLVFPALSQLAVAETQTDITPIGSNMGIEKSLINFSVPENNSLPWAFVEGMVDNAVPDYPVVIQIYDVDDTVSGNPVGGVHFAQTDVNEDGTYEYRFRVTDMNDGSKINVFEGDYVVKIFKVVYLDDNLTVV